MAANDTLHIIDSDIGRRASVSRLTFGIGYHAEVYDGFAEYAETRSKSGIILACDVGGHGSLPEVLVRIGETDSCLPVAIYADTSDPARVVELMLAGAADFLTWPLGAESLLAAVQRIGRMNTETFNRKQKEVWARNLLSTLSRRERDVFEGLLGGSSTKNIAGTLGLSPRTVEVHRAHLMKKLGAQSVIDVALIGFLSGLAIK